MSIDISQINKVHFIGIGGIGMSGLARLFLHEGKNVSGSDRAASDITKALQTEGVSFFESQVETNITNDIDMVIYTEAMSKDHSEMVAASKLGVPMVNYFEALGIVANQYYVIAVSGTHGKTTTTAMLIDIFEDAGLDPTAIVGSLRSKTKSNYRAGKSKYFIVEACEYKRDFLYLEPDILVITNIEAEHLDYYRDLADVQSAFRELAEKVPLEGLIVADTGHPNIKTVLDGLKCKVVDYGSELDLGLTMKLPGQHNRANAAAALEVALFAGIDESVAKTSLENFTGTWRRFEYKGTLNGSPVYDDYAHHPTEIRATIAGTRELYPSKNLIVVFQPHLYSRTAELFDDFVEAVSTADRVIITHVYDARNTGKVGVTGEVLAEAVKIKNKKTTYMESFDEIVEDLQRTVSENDMVLILGAGDVTQVAGRLTQK